MSGFKKGDRVRVLDTPENAHDGFVIDSIVEVAFSHTGIMGDDLVALKDGMRGFWRTDRFELVTEPRKDSPKVGDTVRVVLEGTVTEAGASWWTLLPTGTRKAPIYHQVDWVKSIEIITPAKPSVKDLPVGSVVVGDTGLVLVKRGLWWHGTDGSSYSDAELDRAPWTLLVPKKKEEEDK